MADNDGAVRGLALDLFFVNLEEESRIKNQESEVQGLILEELHG